MDQFKLAITIMAADDARWGPRDPEGRRRDYTPEELDAFADFGWNLPDLKGFLSSLAGGFRQQRRPRASGRLDPAPAPR